MPQYFRKLSVGVRWFYKFSFDGQTYFSKCIFHTKGEAKKAENEKYQELDEQRRFPHLKNDILLGTLIKERLEELDTKKSYRYYKENKAYFDLLLENLGNISVSQITKGDVNNFLVNYANGQHAKGKGNYSVNSMIRVYKALFYYGIDFHNITTPNPCKGIKPFPINKHIKYVPTDTEIDNLLKVCDTEQARLIKFIIETGARIGECLRFKGKDIHPDYIVLYTKKSKNSDLVPRKLPVPEAIKGEKYKAEELVFGRWTELPKFLDKKLRALKKTDPTVKIWGFHNLRHRYASRLSKEGVPLFQIMSLLGHSNLSTTQGYLQLLP